MSRAVELLAFIERLLASNRRLRACVQAVRDDQAGIIRRYQVMQVCDAVTAEDLRGE